MHESLCTRCLPKIITNSKLRFTDIRERKCQSNINHTPFFNDAYGTGGSIQHSSANGFKDSNNMRVHYRIGVHQIHQWGTV